jgi:hypothetical protein
MLLMQLHEPLILAAISLLCAFVGQHASGLYTGSSAADLHSYKLMHFMPQHGI